MDIQIAICDDEDIFCQEIKKNLLRIRPKYKITVYHSGYELIDSKIEFDLIFLDIKMPDIDGMKTAEILRKNGDKSLIIFLTSYIEAMPEAFKVRAFRFLCKPIEEEKFVEAIMNAEKDLIVNRKISAIIKGETKILNITDILYLEAFGDGTYVYTKNDVLESNESLKCWNDRLGSEQFFQIHRTYIVALRYVQKIGSNFIKIKGIEREIPVSRRRRGELKEIVNKYIKEQSRYF